MFSTTQNLTIILRITIKLNLTYKICLFYTIQRSLGSYSTHIIFRKANSKILWWGQLAFRGNSSGEVRFQLLYDGSEVNAGQSGYPYTAQSHCMYGTGCGYFTASSSTGSKQVIWRHRSANGASEAPAQRFNPNGSDDNRIAQQASVLTFMELDF